MSEDKNKKKKAADTAANSAKKPKADAQAKKATVKMNSEKKKPEVRKREMTDRMTSDSMLHQFMPYLIGVAAIFLTACFIFSAVDGAMGSVGTALRNVFCGAFGWAAFLMPLVLLNLAIFWRKYIDMGIVGWKLVLSLVSVVFVSSLIHVFFLKGLHVDQTWGTYAASIFGTGGADSNWKRGVVLSGGGFFGGLVGGLFERLFGFVGSLILLIASITVSVMFLFSITPGYVVTSVRYHAMKAREKKNDRLEAAEKEKRRMREEADKMAERERQRKEREQKERADNEGAVVTDAKDGKISDTPLITGTLEKPQPRGRTSPVPVISSATFMTPAQPADSTQPAPAAPQDHTQLNSGSSYSAPSQREEEKSTVAILNEVFGDGTGRREPKTSAAEPEKAPEKQPAPKKTSSRTDTARHTRFEMSAIANEEKPEDDEPVGSQPSDAVRGKGNELSAYFFPPVDLLKKPVKPSNEDIAAELNNNAQRIMDKLAAFNVKIRKIEYSRGPTITRYELYPEASTRVRSIASLADDISLELASTIRIEAPIPNKNAVGIEVPNQVRSNVYIREMIDSEKFKSMQSKLSACLGKDVGGNMVFFDIGKMPHLLIAGTTGSGKSVCLNTIILSLLYKARPSEVQFIMIDPKKIEMNMYNGLPHMKVPVVTDMKRAAGTLNAAVNEMEHRYNLFEEVNARDLDGFNHLMSMDNPDFVPLPRIVIFIDELADLMMTAPAEIEDSIIRLAQKARAAGIHLIIGTQRPSVNVITGLIKANVPSRIAFSVVSNVESRIIIDIAGAEKLIGKGDMLFAPIGSPKPSRIQGAFVDDDEVRAVTKFIKENSSAVKYDEEFISDIDRETDRLEAEKGRSKQNGEDGDPTEFVQEADPLFNQALHIAVDNGTVATSLLQRKLSIGFGRAGKIIDRMEALSLISGANGTKPRNVLISKQQLMEMEMEKDPRTEGRFV